MSEQIIKVAIVIPSMNEDVDVDVPLNATGSDVIATLVDNEIVKRLDSAGNEITYELAKKGKGSMPIGDDMTLAQAGIKQGDTLLLTPIFVAGCF